MKQLHIIFKIILTSLLFISSSHPAYSQCQAAVNGNTYWVTTDFDNGPGSLRQAILDANADGVGGAIEINGPWINFPIFSQLPMVTCDSLTIFDYIAAVTIDGQNMVPEPGISFSSASSCTGTFVSGINFLTGMLNVTNTNEYGPGSLRFAIQNSNFSDSPDIIQFNIPGPAPHKIVETTVLPRIRKPLTIDGSTQPANGYTGTAPKIEIDGSGFSYVILDFYYGQNSWQYNGAVYGLFIHSSGEPVRANRCNNFILGAPGKGNVLSGNSYGAYLTENSNNVVSSNYLGTDTSGTTALGNSLSGLTIAGGPAPIPSQAHLIQNNLISGNERGILLYSEVLNVTIKGNLIGTDKTGSYAIPNTACGISSGASLMTIGGTQPGDGNLFSGNGTSTANGNSALYLLGGDSIIVIGNKFGTNLAGTDSIPNFVQSNIHVQTNHVRIGGPSAAERNIISSAFDGIYTFLGIEGTEIQNNYFGTDISGTISLPNNRAIVLSNDSTVISGNKIYSNYIGIMLGNPIVGNVSSDNIVSGNEIYSNSLDGIRNWGDRNTFTQNSIYNNGSAGIYNYQFANDSIVPPVVNYVSVDSVMGTSLPTATIELFYSLSQNLNAQGQQYIATVVADALGNWEYNGPISNPLFVTATQTDAIGNTSEFSELWPQVTTNVWPGDCNYDLTVNNLDFLYLGMAVGNTGPVRNNATLNWTAQPATDWTTEYFSGINHKHADTDGNGVVNMQDDIAINQNYSLTHLFRIQSPSTTAVYDFILTAINDTIAPGGYASFSINAGTTSLPIPTLYGLKWSLLFDATLIDTSSIIFDYSTSALGNFSQNAATFEKSFYTSNQIDAAASRIDQNDTMNVAGQIGIIHLLSKPTILNLSTLLLNANSVLGLNMNGEEINFNAQSGFVIIDPSFVGIADLNSKDPVLIYPNPASDEITVICPGSIISNIKIYDALGKLIFVKSIQDSKTNISIENLKAGVYSLEVIDENGNCTRQKLIKQ